MYIRVFLLRRLELEQTVAICEIQFVIYMYIYYIVCILYIFAYKLKGLNLKTVVLRKSQKSVFH